MNAFRYIIASACLIIALAGGALLIWPLINGGLRDAKYYYGCMIMILVFGGYAIRIWAFPGK